LNIYQEIKARITARDVAEAYGLSVGRNGLVLCPFHDDHHPSMLVKERFHCFGCGASGDAIDLTARLFRLHPHDAAVKIITDFSLPVSLPDAGLSFSKEERCAREAEFRRQREERKRKQLEQTEKQTARNRKIDQLKSMLSGLQAVKDRFRFLPPETALESEDFTDAVALEGKLTQWLDLLCFGSEKDYEELLRKEITVDGRLIDPVRKRKIVPAYCR